MGGLSLLTLVQRAEAELGLPQSVNVFTGVTDSTGLQMGALANRVIDELRRMHNWVALQTEFVIVVNPPITFTADSPAQSFSLINMSPSTTAITNVTANPNNLWSISGPNLNQATRLASVNSSTSVTMFMESTNTATVTGGTYLFSQDTYTMPQDFDWFTNRTMWDRTNRWELLGPDSPQLDQWHRSGIVATGPRRHFRSIGPTITRFRIWPPPTEIVSPLQLVFEYTSNASVRVNGIFGPTNPPALYYANDADTTFLDDNALIMGIKWMFWEAKGFGSYATLQGRWVDYVNRLIARDQAAGTLSITKRVNPIFISPANVQDGFFPGPVGPNSA